MKEVPPMIFIRKLSLPAVCLCLGLLALSANCAEDKDSKNALNESAACFDRINTWVEGVVNSIDANNGKFTIKGAKLPFASAHAELRSEYAKKVANADASKKQQIAEELSKKWQDKLEKAKTEKESETLAEYSLKTPATGEMVFLVRRSAQDMAFVSAEEDPSQPGGWKTSGELVSIDVYEVPKAAKSGDAQSVSANASLKDLHEGDRVKVGFDSTSNEACAIVRIHDGNGKSSEAAR